jgi:hypothetical protein
MAGATPSTKPFPELPKKMEWLSFHRFFVGIREWGSQFVLDFDPPGPVRQVTGTANNFGIVLTWVAAKKASGYQIYRGMTGDFVLAKLIHILYASKTKVATYNYFDVGDSVTPSRFYWIVPINERGDAGPRSQMLEVSNMFIVDATGVAVGTGSAAGTEGVAVGVGADTSGFTESQAYGYQAVPEFNNEVVFGSTAAQVDIFGFVAGANGQKFRIFAQEQLLTIAAAASTDSTAFFDAQDIVLAVNVRVTVAIPTAATFNVTLTTTGTTLNTAAVSTAANSTDLGTNNCPVRSTAAQGVTITPDVPPAANTGRVRITAYCYRIATATS